MNNKEFTIDNKTLIRVTKTKATTIFNKGKNIWLYTDKVNPINYGIISKSNIKQQPYIVNNNNSGSLQLAVSKFSYDNCNINDGYAINYYIEK